MAVLKQLGSGSLVWVLVSGSTHNKNLKGVEANLFTLWILAII